MRPDWLPPDCSHKQPTEDWCLWCRGPAVGSAVWTSGHPIKTQTTLIWCVDCEDKARAYLSMFGPRKNQ